MKYKFQLGSSFELPRKGNSDKMPKEDVGLFSWKVFLSGLDKHLSGAVYVNSTLISKG